MEDILTRMTLDEVTVIDTSLKEQKSRLQAQITDIDANLEITSVLISALS